MTSTINAKPRNLVLLFDGTTGTFSSKLSNIPVLCSLLSRDPKKQITYYQTGIGTYEPTFSTLGLINAFEKLADDAVAWNLGQHVQDGYRYLMQYYQPGDKIFIFGFSRGSYTARALAGMLQVMGLLFPGNYQSVSLAYSIYSKKYDVPFTEGVGLPEAFKRTFCREVKVHMIGVFDTVASVGAIIPQILPFSSGISHISHFRQALALDEHRTRFMPQLWMGPTTPTVKPFHSASDDDDDDDAKDINGSPRPTPILIVEEPTTIKQVWFAGCHSDIGGGIVDQDLNTTSKLCNIPLKWLLREAVEVGLELDTCAVLTASIFQPYLALATTNATTKAALDKVQLSPSAMERAITSELVKLSSNSASIPAVYKAEALADRHDALSLSIVPRVGGSLGEKFKAVFARGGQRLEAIGWWFLEITPGVKITWNDGGTAKSWVVVWNNGRGRLLPPNPVFHMSVKLRQEATKGTFAVGDGKGVRETRYVPLARYAHKQTKNDVTYVE